LVSETPGSFNDRHTEEITALENATTATERIQIYRRYYASWLAGRKRFTRTFFSTLAEAGFLESKSDWAEHVRSEAVFEDIAVTDLVKYRIPGGKLRVADRELSFRGILRPELRNIDPEVIFVLGGKAWNGFIRESNPIPIDGAPDDLNRIKQVHGYAFETDDGPVIPLVHPSDGAQIRDSYARYLREGLETLEDSLGSI
jgi:uracil-DNA glycosylase